jgi:hypothetical protein
MNALRPPLCVSNLPSPSPFCLATGNRSAFHLGCEQGGPRIWTARGALQLVGPHHDHPNDSNFAGWMAASQSRRAVGAQRQAVLRKRLGWCLVPAHPGWVDGIHAHGDDSEHYEPGLVWRIMKLVLVPRLVWRIMKLVLVPGAPSPSGANDDCFREARSRANTKRNRDYVHGDWWTLHGNKVPSPQNLMRVLSFDRSAHAQESHSRMGR